MVPVTYSFSYDPYAGKSSVGKSDNSWADSGAKYPSDIACSLYWLNSWDSGFIYASGASGAGGI